MCFSCASLLHCVPILCTVESVCLFHTINLSARLFCVELFVTDVYTHYPKFYMHKDSSVSAVLEPNTNRQMNGRGKRTMRTSRYESKTEREMKLQATKDTAYLETYTHRHRHRVNTREHVFNNISAIWHILPWVISSYISYYTIILLLYY